MKPKQQKAATGQRQEVLSLTQETKKTSSTEPRQQKFFLGSLIRLFQYLTIVDRLNGNQYSPE